MSAIDSARCESRRIYPKVISKSGPGFCVAMFQESKTGTRFQVLARFEKWARALDVPLYQIFYEGENTAPPKPEENGLSRADTRFLMQMRRALSHTDETDRQLLLAMARKMASKAA